VSLVGGNGIEGYSGDDGPGALAQFSRPLGTAVDNAGEIIVADSGNSSIRMMKTSANATVLAAVTDAASEAVGAISPGKIVVLYGVGLGPSQLTVFSSTASRLPEELAGTSVSFNGIPAPVIYTSSNQVAGIVPYGLTGASIPVKVSYQGQVSGTVSVAMRGSTPGLFTANGSGAGQAAAINVATGTLNTATTPARAGEYIALYATGEGRTTGSVDGQFAGLPLPTPVASVTATVGGLPAVVQYAGGVYGTVAGLMQVNVMIPAGVRAGGYVPVTVRVGGTESAPGVWISVAK
jgi:uncharacterized protein (TIGR03437 family)